MGPVESALVAELKRIARVDKDLAAGALAASALAMARAVDDEANSATSRSMCGRELRDTLDRVRELMPEAREADGLDDLAARRASRIAANG